MMLGSVNEDALKCLVVGDSGVGKTGMIIRYLGAQFQTRHLQTILDPISVEAFVGPSVVEMCIFDTACQEQYDRLRHLYYPETDVFLVCCSTRDVRTLDSARVYWFPTLRRAVPEAKIVLVGTRTDTRTPEKTDKQQEKRVDINQNEETDLDKIQEEVCEGFSATTGVQVARELKAHAYVECSALTGDGIREAFKEAILSVMDPVTGQRREKKLKRDANRTQSLPMS